MTATAQAREQTESPKPRQPARRSPLIAALLALIPGLGHFYVNERLRGLILILLLPLMVALTMWRLEVAGVDLGAGRAPDRRIPRGPVHGEHRSGRGLRLGGSRGPSGR